MQSDCAGTCALQWICKSRTQMTSHAPHCAANAVGHFECVLYAPPFVEAGASKMRQVWVQVCITVCHAATSERRHKDKRSCLRE